MTIGYPSGPKTFQLKTPVRKHNVKRFARRSYASLASSVVQSKALSGRIVGQVASKIRCEMADISSKVHDSILKDNIEALKHFSWDTVFLELQSKMPTLMMLLKKLVRNPTERKPLLCVIASQLLKQRQPKLGLVQRAVSILMYGNGTSKQVRIFPMHNHVHGCVHATSVRW